ncbi:class I SAM-dependent methyltransferase [Cellulomonas sp. zg-B12]|nr:class I SAM-dependent methyltransferase [Cellulomonas xiejunii]
MAATSGARWTTATDYDSLARNIQFRNAALLARLHPHPSQVRAVLEIGCGTGGSTVELVAALPDATIDAMDISDHMLAVALAKGLPDRVRFRQAQFPDVGSRGPYDAIFSNAALHWMYPHYETVFAAMNQALHLGGYVCAATAARTRSTERVATARASALSSLGRLPEEDTFDCRRLTASDVEALAGGSGFIVEDAFVVERTALVSADVHARWWVASGGPWTANEVAPEEAVQALTDALGGSCASVETVHASVMFRLRKAHGDRANT